MNVNLMLLFVVFMFYAVGGKHLDVWLIAVFGQIVVAVDFALENVKKYGSN